MSDKIEKIITGLNQKQTLNKMSTATQSKSLIILKNVP